MRRLACLLALSCATTSAPMKLSTQTPVTVAYVLDFDDDRKPTLPPKALAEAVHRDRKSVV